MADAAAAAAEGFSSADTKIRYDACRALAALGAEAAAPHLQALQAVADADKDSDVRRAAKKALKDLSAGIKRPAVGAVPPTTAAKPAAPVRPAAATAPVEPTAVPAVTETAPSSSSPPEETSAPTTSGTGAAVEEAAAGPAEYCVMQGPLFKKLGADPTTGKVTKLNMKVGTKVKSSGKSWTGPSGGEWVELDPASGKPGWLLVEGPGFGQPGPLLEKVMPEEEGHMVLDVRNPVDDSMFQICVKPDQRVRQAKSWIALRIPGLKFESIVVTREKEGKQDASFMLEDTKKMRDTPFKDGGELFFMYNGSVEEDTNPSSA